MNVKEIKRMGIVVKYNSLLKLSAQCGDTNVTKMLYCLEVPFSTSPASTKYHGNYPGGLVDHTLIVTKLALQLYDIMSVATGGNLNCTKSSLIKCCILHDIGKIGAIINGDMVYNYIENPDKIERKKIPYINNKEIPSSEHWVRVFHILSHYGIKLSDEETTAIHHHNGAYIDSYKNLRGDGGRDLLIILHSADNMAAKILGV